MPTKCPTCHTESPEDKPFCANCGTKLGLSPSALPSITRTLDLPAHSLEKGSVFADRYEIIEQLGEGGMGQVYRAHDTQIEEDIAIKVLRPEIALDKRILERFRNELKFARKITHKSVCRMHDISVFDGTTFITMEYVEGEDLKSVIKRKGKLGIGQAVSVTMQIVDGLAEAHNLGIVHRDLKPQNIMIDPEGSAKIMDFGIARSTKAEGVTQEGSIIGTPEYMSPEQVEGRTVDQRSDIYSLAVILFEMLTGQIPFSGETVLEIAFKHKSQQPDNPQQFNKKIPDALAALILLSMEKDPQERFQSADDLLRSLINIQENFPESERSAMRIVPRLPGQKIALFSFKKVLIPTGAVAAIIVIALITWRLLFPPQPVDVFEGRPTLAVLYFNNNTGDPSYDKWRNILPDVLTSDLMQSKYLSVVSQTQIYSFLDRKGLLDARNYSVEDLEELVDEVKANFLAQGFFTKSGENFELSVTLLDAKSLDLVGAEEVSGRGIDSFPSMVDELTPKIKPYLGITAENISNDFDEDIAQVTTADTAAYDFYVRARRARSQLRHKETVEFLDKAIALDPDFASAYQLKAYVHDTHDLENLEGEAQKKIESAKRAHEIVLRKDELGIPVTERERLLIESMYFLVVERNRLKQKEKLEELIAVYPDDYDANHILGDFHWDIDKNVDKAAKHFETCLQSELVNVNDYGYLTNIYWYTKQYDKSREICRLALEKFPEFYSAWQFHRAVALTYSLEGKHDQALAECENMYRADPLAATYHEQRGLSYIFMEDFEAAEEEFFKLLEKENLGEHRRGRIGIINLYRLQGRFEDIHHQLELAKENPTFDLQLQLILYQINQGDFEKAENASAEWAIKDLFWKPYFQGLLKIKMKQWDEVFLILDNWPSLFRNTWVPDIRNLYLLLSTDLRGRVELEKGNHELAIEYLEKTKALIPYFNYDGFAWHVEPLARAFYELGKLKRAREEYDLITTLKWGRLFDGDIYAKSFYMLGKIAEEMGEKREARKQYQRFLELWKDADPGLPELEDAKTRLADL